MFRSSKEFEDLLLNVLKSVYREDELEITNLTDSWQDDISDLQFHDVLAYAVDKGLLTGIRPELESDGSLFIHLSTPRLTYDGLKFIGR